MQSSAKDVTTYINEAPAERREALLKLRALRQKYLTGFTESMAYGGPTYSRDGEVEVGFASQKNFIGLYILRTDVMKTHRDQLKGKGVSIGKGAIRYSKRERIKFDVVVSMLRATVESTGQSVEPPIPAGHPACARAGCRRIRIIRRMQFVFR